MKNIYSLVYFYCKLYIIITLELVATKRYLLQNCLCYVDGFVEIYNEMCGLRLKGVEGDRRAHVDGFVWGRNTNPR